MLGADAADRLFGTIDPLDKTITISDSHFLVVGIATAKGAVFGQSQDEYAVIPLPAFRRVFGARPSLQLTVLPTDEHLVKPAMDDATVAMRIQRRLRPKQPDNFGVVSSGTFLALYEQATAGLFAILIGVVSLSLVVGGIVIMNIMLMVVTERTREIGLRKSLGARRRDILWQILTESITLSTFGGLLGTGLGFLVAFGISKVSPLPAIVEPWSVILGISVTAFVGLFFGIYPALKAASLDPDRSVAAGVAMRGGLFTEIVTMAWETLRGNKMRSALTVLGVVIGIMSIVGMTSLIRGFDESLRDSIKTIGPDTIFVAKFSAVSLSSGASFDEMLKRPNMTPQDADAIGRAPSIEASTVILGQGGPAPQERVYFRDQKTKPLLIFGTTDVYPSLTHIQVELGRFFNEQEVQRRRQVIVLGQNPYQALFPNSDPIGKKVRLGLIQYEVIGVMAKRPTPGGFDTGRGRQRDHPAVDLPEAVRHPRVQHRPR